MLLSLAHFSIHWAQTHSLGKKICSQQTCIINRYIKSTSIQLGSYSNSSEAIEAIEEVVNIKNYFRIQKINIYSVLSFEQTDRMECKNRFSW